MPEWVDTVAGARRAQLHAHDYFEDILAGERVRPMFRLISDPNRRLTLAELFSLAYSDLGRPPAGTSYKSELRVYNGARWVTLATATTRWRRHMRDLLDQHQGQGGDVVEVLDSEDEDVLPLQQPPQGPAAAAAEAVQSQCCICFTDAPEPALTAGCGAVYCQDCLKHTIRHLGPDSAIPKCGHQEHQQHELRLTPAMGKVLQKAGLMGRVACLLRKHKYDEFHTRCPECSTTIIHGNFSKVLVCPNEACVNPPYGYCSACLMGISQLPHDCRSEHDKHQEELTRQFLAEHGVHPCPGCGNAAEKLDGDMCHHLVCLCGTRYCAACGFQFEVQQPGGRVISYEHPCPARNIFRLAGTERAAVRRAYGLQAAQ